MFVLKTIKIIKKLTTIKIKFTDNNDMKKSFNKVTSQLLTVIFLTVITIFSTGCGKSGVLEEPVSYVTPTIQNLQAKSRNIAKCTGGILSFSCDWTSPTVVTDSKAYLSFVKTIDLPITEPIGVMGSATEMITNTSARAVMTNERINYNYGDINPEVSYVKASVRAAEEVATDVVDPEATADFYRKYADPIVIPVRINSEEKSGQFYSEVPFTINDIASAPLGVHQMMFYMRINGYKTNTLSFELTFVP